MSKSNMQWDLTDVAPAAPHAAPISDGVPVLLDGPEDTEPCGREITIPHPFSIERRARAN